jgi:LPS-assembly protein
MLMCLSVLGSFNAYADANKNSLNGQAQFSDKPKITVEMIERAKQVDAATSVKDLILENPALQKTIENKQAFKEVLSAALKNKMDVSRQKEIPPPEFSSHDWQSLTDKSIAKTIGWVDDVNAGNFCCGYYQSPILNLDNQSVVPVLQAPTEINAMQTQFEQHGDSILIGKVISKQPGRLLTAEKAYLYRNHETGKINTADFYGDVHLYEPNKLITGQYAHLHFDSDKAEVNNAIYRMNTKLTLEKELPEKTVDGLTHIFSLNAWGRALKIKRIKKGLFELFEASYTSCAPTHSVWMMKAKRLVLNQNKGWGQAWHSKLYVKGLPVFYWPYFNFPIDDRRKSGFLYPSYGLSTTSGATFTIPYYWNMAPNYDWLITPVSMAKRGVQLNNHFRFLTSRDKGSVQFSFLPNDAAFKNFRDNATIAHYVGRQADLDRLQDLQANRWQLRLLEETQYNANWSTAWDLHRVSDDYYFEDFSSKMGSQDQLLQSFSVKYADDLMGSNIAFKNFQTLHPIDQSPLGNPYNQLPVWNFNGHLPYETGGLRYETRGEMINFTHYPTPAQSENIPYGQRLWMRPGVSYPIQEIYGYLTPSIKLDMAKDFVHYQETGFDKEPQRAIPLFVLKGGVFFERPLSWFKQDYTQTLEPEAQYLYVPTHYQGDFPLFTTGLSSMSYTQIFSDNRFTDVDRFGDANQVALGLTSRFMESYTGLETVTARVAELIYFKDRVVRLCTTPGCHDISGISDKNRHSPVITELDYQMNPNWRVSTQALWETNDLTPLSQAVHFNYRSDYQHIFNIGYTFSQPQTPFRVGGLDVNRQDQVLGSAPKQLISSILWPIPFVKQWAMIGYANYDVAQHHALGTYWGAEYNTCCFAIRALSSREFKFNDYPTGQHIYNNTFYLQFVLKGLGTYGLHNPNGLLSEIDSYKDPYKVSFSSFQ